MKEDQTSNGSTYRAWIDRLSQALSGEPKDRDQLIRLLREAQGRGLFDVEAQGMIEGVLQVADMQARDIMIPRSQMVVVSRDADPAELISVAIESGHSRFPVVGDSRDEVVGVLLAKDLLRYSADKEPEQFSIRDALRPAVFVPESKRLNVLLKDFRSSRNHLAIVVDEYGGVAGMVTIEDVLEQIVGEIEDEHDIEAEDAMILPRGDGRYVVKALLELDEFNDYFHTNFALDDVDTVGGLVLTKLEHVPKRGETLDLDDMQIKVLRADSRRVHLLEVRRRQKPETVTG